MDANIKAMFLGLFNTVLKRIIVNAPRMPIPLAKLSPIACITVAVTLNAMSGKSCPDTLYVVAVDHRTQHWQNS